MIRFTTVWEVFHGSAMNMGIRGEKIQHVIARVTNIVFPKSVCSCVIHVGTNNLDSNSAGEICEGILLCASMLRSKVKMLLSVEFCHEMAIG